MAFFALRVRQGIWAPGFGDESEHFVGAKVLQAGGVLYRTYLDAHGPLVFMLAQLYGAIFGWAHPNWARLIPALLAACAGLSVAAAPGLVGVAARLAAATLFFGLTAAVWLTQALYMVNYYAIGGWFLLVAIAWFVVPAWRGSPVPVTAAFISGVCFLLAAFAAYSLMPSVCMLAASGAWAVTLGGQRRRLATFLGGGASAVLGVLIWFLMFGDLRGYLAFHIVANQFVYAQYINFGAGNFLRSLVPLLRPDTLVQALGIVCCAWSSTVFLLDPDHTRNGIQRSGGFGRRREPPIVLGIAGVFLLNARGTPWFQNGTFLVAAIGLAALATPVLLLRAGLSAQPWRQYGCVLVTVVLGVGCELAIRNYAIASPSRLTYREIVRLSHSNLGQQDTPMFNEVRAIVRPDERVLALVYDPGFYLAVGRLPMAKYYEYLPWDADYAKTPWFGRDHDLCADLARSPPPLVYFDNWTVWNAFAPVDYMPCVLDILARTYKREADFPRLYIRNDRAVAAR